MSAEFSRLRYKDLTVDQRINFKALILECNPIAPPVQLTLAAGAFGVVRAIDYFFSGDVASLTGPLAR